MKCSKVVGIAPDGTQSTQPKIGYNTLDEAIKAAKHVNSHPKTITKHVAYKCNECHKYHIGRNGKPITEKYLNKLKTNDGLGRKTFVLKKEFDENLLKNFGIYREVEVRRVVDVF